MLRLLREAPADRREVTSDYALIRLYDTLPDTSRQRPASTVAGSDCGGRRLSFSSFSTSEMTPSEAPSQGGYQG
eukprot:1913943-Pyramimonas_sp.AAC.1